MRKSYLPASLILGFFLLLSHFTVFSSDFSAIENPKPNIVEKEKQYVQLKKIKIIDADLGNSLYIFKPSSIAGCSNTTDVFIYDILQAKIYKVDSELEVVKTSFGNKGVGPGEFGGTGKGYPVFIQMGRDGKLYANCSRMRKIIIFDQDGKFIREFKHMSTTMSNPLVDSSGNLHMMNVKDKIINVYNEKKSPLFTLSNQEDNFNYLFSKPGPFYLRMASQYLESELLTALTIKSRYLLYFPSSSIMVILQNKKVLRQMRLWPQEALKFHKMRLGEVKEKSKNAYLPLFSNLFVDEDNDDVFFLQFGRDKTKGINTLYQFNVNGELMKVLYVTFNEGSAFTRFKLKKNNRFYAIEGDKLAMYKEEKK